MNDSAMQKIVIPKNRMIVRHDHDTKNMPQKTAWYLEPYSSLVWLHEYSLDGMENAQFCVEFFLSENSSLQYIPVLQGGSRVDFDITLNLEQGAHASISGAYSLKDTEQHTIRTRQQHHGKNATSMLSFNGIAADQSFLNYQGTIAVEKTAINTNASQENKTIIWGSGARAISIPALEVKTNEVRCAHGSAIGPLNKDHIHYVQSRGVSLQEAHRLLLTSFFSETLATLKDNELKRRIIDQLIARALNN